MFYLHKKICIQLSALINVDVTQRPLRMFFMSIDGMFFFYFLIKFDSFLNVKYLYY